MSTRLPVKGILRFAALCAILFVFGWGSYTMGRNALMLYREKARGERDIAALEAKIVMIRQELAALEEPARIEREAKERLNMKAPGEEVLVVLPDESLIREEIKERSFWQRFRDFVRELVR